MSALADRGSGRWRPLAGGDVDDRFCANAAHEACNGLVAVDNPEAYRIACRINRAIPDLEVPENVVLWRRLEAAKHHLAYGLPRQGQLPRSTNDDPAVVSASPSSPAPVQVFRQGRKWSPAIPAN